MAPQTIWRTLSEKRGQVTGSTESSDLSPFPALSRNDYSSFFLKLLANRSLQTPEEIERFLSPRREDLLNPFLMKGMREAVARLQKAQAGQEKVLVHGDYDVDGVTGAAILGLTFQKLGILHEIFLPERKRDGYGVSGEALAKARKDGIRLLVTVDCGISAAKEIREAREAGMETIVLDHHRIPLSVGATHASPLLPPALAILNPLQEDCAYPFKELSAGGLAFKLAQALLGPAAFEFFDLATLSTVADLAPLRGENRILVREGLRQLSSRNRVGIKALAEAAKLRSHSVNTGHVGFVFGPRINASGRMSSALTALRLLLTTNEKEAASLAGILEEENRGRRGEEKRVLNEALAEVERTINFSRERMIVVAREGWHAGVIGIVASRLVERYHRPALVIALEGGKGKGSGRSIRNFHLFNALEAARGHFIEFGGHEQAVGFSLEAEKISRLKKVLNDYAHQAYPPEIFLKSIDIDLEISFRDLAPRFLRELELLEPFGVGNPKPVFLTRGLFLRSASANGRGGGFETRPYKRIWVTDGTFTYQISATERSGVRLDFDTGEKFDLVFTVNQKSWNGEKMVVLEAKDVKPAEENAAPRPSRLFPPEGSSRRL